MAADALWCGGIAGLLSGLPSTAHALWRRRDPLEASRAAGTLLLPEERSTAVLLVSATVVHAVLSVGWAVVLSVVLPRRSTIAAGMAAGVSIALLDLSIGGRLRPSIATLPVLPQLADHVLYGALVGAVLARRRAGRYGR